uniref:Uncharacterized protein n=1 Tax=Arundo donax TaxID=35708 RepID=A0A0A8YXE8_ARUDO
MIGLHINYDKSTLVPMNISAEDAIQFASVFGCPMASFPQKYLDHPLSDSKLRLIDLQPSGTQL